MTTGNSKYSRSDHVIAGVLFTGLAIGFTGLVIGSVTALGASFWPFVSAEMLQLALMGSAALLFVSLLFGSLWGEVLRDQKKETSASDEDIQPTKPQKK